MSHSSFGLRHHLRQQEGAVDDQADDEAEEETVAHGAAEEVELEGILFLVQPDLELVILDQLSSRSGHHRRQDAHDLLE